MAGEYTVVYKALADFSQLQRQADQAKASLASLQAQNDRNNASADASAAAHTRLGGALSKLSGLATVARADQDNLRQSTDSLALAVARQDQTHQRTISSQTALTKAEQDAKTPIQVLTDLRVRAAQSVVNEGAALLRTVEAHRQYTAASNNSAAGSNTFLNSIRQLSQGSAVTSVTSVLGTLGNLVKSIGPLIGAIAIFAQPAISAIVGLAGSLGSLVSSAGPAVGALAALPQAFSILAQGAGTLILALGGVFKAFQAYNQQVASGINVAQQQAQQYRLAAQAVVQAEHGITEAQYTSQQAQVGLTQARIDATRALEDLQRQVANGSLTEQEALARVAQAQAAYQKALADPTSSTSAIQQAQFALADAKDNLDQVNVQNQRNSQDLAKQQKAGVEGSQQVVQAKHAVKDATYGQQQAEVALTNALYNQTQVAVTSQTAFQKAMSSLSASAQQFVKFLEPLHGIFKTLQDDAGKQLFPGLEAGITSLEKLLPVVEPILTKTGGAIGKLFQQFAAQITTPKWLDFFTQIGNNNVGLITTLGDAFSHIADAIMAIVKAAEPLTKNLTDAFDGATKTFDNFINSLKGQQDLTRWFGDGTEQNKGTVYKSLASWGGLLSAFSRLLLDVFSPSSASGNDLVTRMTDALRKWDAWAQTNGPTLEKFFSDSEKVTLAVANLLGAISKGIGELFMNGGASSAISILSTLATLVQGPLVAILQSLGQHSGDLASIAGSLATVVGSLLGAGSPLVGVALNSLAWFANILADISKNKPTVDVILGIAGLAVSIKAIGSAIDLISGAKLAQLLLFFKSPSIAGIKALFGIGSEVPLAANTTALDLNTAALKLNTDSKGLPGVGGKGTVVKDAEKGAETLGKDAAEVAAGGAAVEGAEVLAGTAGAATIGGLALTAAAVLGTAVVAGAAIYLAVKLGQESKAQNAATSAATTPDVNNPLDPRGLPSNVIAARALATAQSNQTPQSANVGHLGNPQWNEQTGQWLPGAFTGGLTNPNMVGPAVGGQALHVVIDDIAPASPAGKALQGIRDNIPPLTALIMALTPKVMLGGKSVHDAVNSLPGDKDMPGGQLIHDAVNSLSTPRQISAANQKLLITDNVPVGGQISAADKKEIANDAANAVVAKYPAPNPLDAPTLTQATKDGYIAAFQKQFGVVSNTIVAPPALSAFNKSLNDALHSIGLAGINLSGAVSVITKTLTGISTAAQLASTTRDQVPQYHAAGGHVSGTGESDTVPAMLTPGEFVIRKRAVEAIGLENLKAINGFAGGGYVGDEPQHFAFGGAVGGVLGALAGIGALTTAQAQQAITTANTAADTSPAGSGPLAGFGQAGVANGWQTSLPGQVNGTWIYSIPPGGSVPTHIPSPSAMAALPKGTPLYVQNGFPLRPGESSKNTVLVQQYLGVPQTGVYDAPTQNAVVAWHKATGRGAGTTLTSLDFSVMFPGGAGADFPLLPGMKNNDYIKQIQTALTTAGYYGGAINGNYDSATQQAITEFETAFNLPITTTIDSTLFSRLISATPYLDTTLDTITRDVAAQKKWNSGLLQLAAWGDKYAALWLNNVGIGGSFGDSSNGSIAPSAMQILSDALTSPSKAQQLDSDAYQLGLLNGTILPVSMLSNQPVTTGTLLPDLINFASAVALSPGAPTLQQMSIALRAPDSAIYNLWQQGGGQLSSVLPASKLTTLLTDFSKFAAGLYYGDASGVYGQNGLLPRATGGRVPGVGDSDSVSAVLTPGEFVIRKAAAQAIGMHTLNAMNNADKVQPFDIGGFVQEFAGGGYVQSSPYAMKMAGSAMPMQNAGSAGSSKTVNYNFDTQINNPIAETPTYTLSKMITRKAQLGVLSGQD